MSLFRLRLQNAPTELSLLLYHLSYLSVALVTLSGALFPRGMLIDLVYNLGIRHLIGAPSIPPTPTPRRFS